MYDLAVRAQCSVNFITFFAMIFHDSILYRVRKKVIFLFFGVFPQVFGACKIKQNISFGLFNVTNIDVLNWLSSLTFRQCCSETKLIGIHKMHIKMSSPVRVYELAGHGLNLCYKSFHGRFTLFRKLNKYLKFFSNHKISK